MSKLIVGLIFFLGAHSLRLWAGDGARNSFIRRLGIWGYKGAYSAVSLLGLWLLVAGYNEVRGNRTYLWSVSPATQHLANPLFLLAMVLLAAAYVPRNHIRRWAEHPMTLAVTIWSVGHLMVAATIVNAVLFGCFLIWSFLLFFGVRAINEVPNEHAATVAPKASIAMTVITVLAGVGLWFGSAQLHGKMIGVPVFGI